LIAGTINPLIPDKEYLEYGSKFYYILNICGINKNGDTFTASCVAIKDNYILTAAHVVNDVEFCGIVVDDSKIIIVDQITKHPDFVGMGSKADIAICKLKDSLDLKFYPKLYSDKDEDQKVCSISGYGYSGTFITGKQFYDGKKRAGSNIIDRCEEDILICSPSKSVADELTQLEFIISVGDSGGGLFIDGKLAGINSFISAINKKPMSVYGDEAAHTRISTYIEWIDENTR
jgi:S1-C subfamily serine protease